MNFRAYLVFLCFLAGPVCSNTHISTVKFDYLTVDDGLSQGIVQDIMQDRRGFMWIATRDGLNRYDGKEFRYFRHDRNDANSLASNLVYCINEDREGNIWIGSNGLNRYDPLLGRMFRIPANPLNQHDFHGGWVYNIVNDPDGTIWMASSNGLIHYNPKNEQFTYYTHNASIPESIGSNLVYDICISQDLRIFVATDTDPVYEFNRTKNSFIRIEYKDKYKGNNAFKRIKCDQNGLLYIFSENAGLHIYNPSEHNSRLVDVSNGLNVNTIKSIQFLSEEEVWLGTDGGGINVFNPGTGKFIYLKTDTKNDKSLNGNAIYQLYKDKDQNIWVGHFGTGISIWKRNKEKFLSYRHNPLNPASINKEIVCAIFQDSKRRIWIGQDGGGLSLFNESTQSFEHFRHTGNDPFSPGTDVILTINETPEGNLLLGTFAGGMMVFNPENRKVIRTFTTKDGLSSDNIWSIRKDSRGRFWLLTLRGGVILFDPNSNTFKSFVSGGPDPGMCSQDLITMAEDNEGNLWFGTDNNGVCVFDPVKEKLIKNYTHNEKNLNSLSDNSIRSIIISGKFAWIATNGGGLNRLDMASDSFKVYTIQDGLSSDALMGILQDKGGNLWISSTRGLMKFDPKTEKVITFDNSDGIQGSEFKYNAQEMLINNRMAFGGVNGLTLFNPDSIRFSPVVPEVVFVDITILDKPVIPGIKGSPLDTDIDFVKAMTLRYNQSTFTIRFAALDYNAPENNRYSYKMEGYDKTWINAGNNNSAAYTNLRPGKYTFLLKGSNSDGIWNESARQIEIRIRPPWYRTKLAILIIIMLAAYLIWRFYKRQRGKQAILDNQLLQERISSAQLQLETKIQEVESQKEEIKRRDLEEQEIRFFTEGTAKFSDIISKQRRNVDGFANALISDLVKYVNASVGVFYILEDEDPSNPLLKIIAGYNFTPHIHGKDKFEVGEGYIGTCFNEKKTLKLDDLPDKFVILASGLGEISLRHSILVPLIEDNKCCGVIEIASIDKLPDYKTGFIEKIAGSIASVITIMKISERINKASDKNEIAQ